MSCLPHRFVKLSPVYFTIFIEKQKLCCIIRRANFRWLFPQIVSIKICLAI